MVLTLVFGVSTPLLAQQVPDPILEEERRRQLEQRTNELGTLERRGGAPDPGPAQARGGPCFQINRLTVEGVTLLSLDELAAITSKYVPRCMQGADIQAVMRELDAAYADQGYITSKTYIPPQNLQDGELVLSMLEGTVEDILLIDAEQQIESKRGERQLKTAFPNAEGELFQLRDFEQGLDQMNRLASVEAILKLQPGEEPGGSYVIVQRVQEDRVRGYARLDNQGSESTGRNKLSFDLEVDDLFGANDAWTFGYAGSENTNALSVFGSVPYGYWTFETELAYSEYLTPLNALSELFGASHTAGLKARYVAHRDQTSTTELNFGVRVRKSDRFINDVRLTPQNLSTFTLGIKHLRLGEKARNSYDATLTFGTTLFGADKDAPGIGSDIPRAQFFKINAGWQRQGALGQAGTLVTDLRAQWSPHTLYGTEQLSLGSYSTVRGYEASAATGDMGLYMRNDLYLTPNIWDFLPEEAVGKVVSKTQTHIFLDTGITNDHARGVSEKVAGLGFGLSYYHKRFTLSGTVGVPLIQDNSFDIGDPVFQARMDLKTW
jgi:hemolysin activation/secretion protein